MTFGSCPYPLLDIPGFDGTLDDDMPSKKGTKRAPSNGAQADPLDLACAQLMAVRNRPLLIMFYPPGASITEDDIGDIYDELRGGGLSKENPAPSLDLLLHTYGGDPVAAYRIAQTIRSLTKELTVLIPEFGYSAGTLLSFAGDSVRLGAYAGLSPIDITLMDPSSPAREGVQLAAVDSFLEFAQTARRKMEKALRDLDRPHANSSVDSDLLVQMVKEVGAIKVGKYYRERRLTGHYAQILLQQYMFKKCSDCQDRTNGAISHFLFGAPAHEFHLDFHLCNEWHLMVKEMSTAESDLAKAATLVLKMYTVQNRICHRLNQQARMPFIGFYPYVEKKGKNNASRSKARNANSSKAHPNVPTKAKRTGASERPVPAGANGHS